MSEELILEKLDHMANNITDIKGQLNNLTNPKNGVVTDIQKFQASCPRKTLKWIWLVIIPIGVANTAVAIAAVIAIVKMA